MSSSDICDFFSGCAFGTAAKRIPDLTTAIHSSFPPTPIPAEQTTHEVCQPGRAGCDIKGSAPTSSIGRSVGEGASSAYPVSWNIRFHRHQKLSCGVQTVPDAGQRVEDCMSPSQAFGAGVVAVGEFFQGRPHFRERAAVTKVEAVGLIFESTAQISQHRFAERHPKAQR